MRKDFCFSDYNIEVSIGKYAGQADGAVWIKAGNNIVLVTAVASKKAAAFMGFLPLIVEYRERTSAAGKIPGGYIKREGRLSDLEVLTSRLIDRPIRPLFPSDYFKEIQVLSTVYSSDGLFPTNILALLGSSLALTLSPIPFLGPIGAVKACRVDGKWKFNSSYEEQSRSDANIIIVGTMQGICMVDGHCNNVLEQELIELLFDAHEEIKKQVEWQLEVQKELGIVKDPVGSEIDWDGWKKKIQGVLPENFTEELFASTKIERSKKLEKLKSGVFEKFAQNIKDSEVSESVLSYTFESLLKDVFADVLIQKKARIDGRSFDKVRDISIEVGLLPCAHGSSVFTRGETQAISSLTLGTAQDAQRVESLLGGEQERSFMLHYNFPPFSTGEVKFIRGASRRDIGHGYLAESSFLNVLPSREKFPYVVRSVVDILESNGSSSMATVCATTMALMDAGVPIKDMISGIAMGLVKDSSGKCHVLTDIMGTEDAYGLMDFKVTGTDKGIMAFQLDIKDKVGLSKELLVQALEQARKARIYILDEMKKIIGVPRSQISELAPRVSTLTVPQSKIGLIIGPSGKNIREIIAQTDTQIDIEDDGKVNIFCKSKKGIIEAERWIKTLVGDIDRGTIYPGVIKRIAEFGLIVELVPGKDGMVHISTIARDKQRDLDRRYKINDKLTVKVVAVDQETGRIRLVAPELE